MIPHQHDAEGSKNKQEKGSLCLWSFCSPIFFVSRKVQHLGGGGGGGACIHMHTPTYVFTCLQWNQATWKILFYWLSSSGRIPPGNAFVQYVSYIMCPGPCRPSDMRTALVQQLMDETSSSGPHRLDFQLTSAQRLTIASHSVASENLLILDWFAACILAASKLFFFFKS